MPATTPILRLLVISNRHGDDATLHATEDAAKDALHDYVAYWWEQDGPGGAIPDDRDTAIVAYFYNEAAGESYDIRKVGLPDLAPLDLPALYDLDKMVGDAIAARHEAALVAAVREMVQQHEGVREGALEHGAPSRVRFGTTEADNGWFLYTTEVDVVFSNGTGETFAVEDGPQWDALDEALANVSSDYQPLTGMSTYEIDLGTGKTDFTRTNWKVA